MLNLLWSEVGERWKWNKFGPIYERCFVFMVLVKFSANQVGKRLKWNKFGPINERCFVFTVLVKFSGSQKISAQNLAIMEMIYMLFLVLCNSLEGYLLLGNQKL